jgi:hypothetical protein
MRRFSRLSAVVRPLVPALRAYENSKVRSRLTDGLFSVGPSTGTNEPVPNCGFDAKSRFLGIMKQFMSAL